MKTKLSLIIGALFALCGCVPTLHSLYTEKDIVFDKALLGTWTDANSKDSWTFERDGEKAYRLIYKDSEEKSGRFEVHLFKIGNQQFLDLFPDVSALKELKQNDLYRFHLFPVHTFAKVTQIEPALQMAFADPKWFEAHLNENPKALRHERIEDRIVLTASTQELQDFIRKHAETKGPFGEASDLRRK